jgi:hypothetical protein
LRKALESKEKGREKRAAKVAGRGAKGA